jgi:hypothetical protein
MVKHAFDFKHKLRTWDSRKFPKLFDIDVLVHREFLPPGQSVTGHFYVQVLLRWHDAVQRKWQGHWFLHHDKAPSHILLVVQQFLTKRNIPVITQPPYSPDLALRDFQLFPTRIMGLKGIHFATMENSKSGVTSEL